MALTLQLRWSLIDERIAAHGGALAVQRASGINRSTLSRWRNNGALPNDPLQFLKLARALDIDPFLLFELERERFGETCFAIGKLLTTGRLRAALRSLEVVGTLWSQTGRREWPPACIEAPSGKIEYRWHTGHFVHEGQLGSGDDARNFYASIMMQGPRISTREAPQVWYFAYRDRVGWSSSWHPYGAVALVGSELELYAFHGEKVTASAPGPFAIQTWFGEGDAAFCVASLHPFTLDVTRDLPQAHAFVRFSLPRRRLRS